MTCNAPIALSVYPPHDNVDTLILEPDGVVLGDLSAVTRVTVDLGGTTTLIDSAVVGSSVIWWTDQLSHRGKTIDVLRLRLGGQSIPAATYSGVKIAVYDGVSINGLRIKNDITITVLPT